MSEQSFKEHLVQDVQAPVGESALKVFFLRRGSGTFPQELATKMRDLKMTKVLWAMQSESDGNISMTIFYE